MSEPRPATRLSPDPDKPRTFVFVLLDNFSMLSFSAAVEAMRIANRMAGRTVYTWRVIGEGGTSMTCSAGISFNLDGDLDELGRDDTLIICGGIGIQAATSKRILGWLRREARKGIAIGGLCTAAFTLAKAGLLDGKRATIHWENQDSFSEEFDEVELTKSVFVRLSVPTRIGVRHPKLSQVIQMMETNIEEPISPSILARDVGMSTRQLERLFRRYLNRSPKRYYMELRLQKARNLLMQTDMSVINVALACGFASPSHFSKCYRAHYDTTPYREFFGGTDEKPYFNNSALRFGRVRRTGGGFFLFRHIRKRQRCPAF